MNIELILKTIQELRTYVKENLEEEKKFVALYLCNKIRDEVKKYES